MHNLLTLTLLGTPAVRVNGNPVAGFRSAKSQALLYYLAVTGRVYTRPTLAGLLWGDQPEAAARASLSKCLSNLHKLLGNTILIEGSQVVFNRDQPYHLDTERFATAVKLAPAAETVAALQTALALYRGDFLEGFYVRNAPDFEQWVLVQRTHYREAMVGGLHALATYAEQQGDLPAAIGHTRRLLALEPWREEAHRQLMTHLAQSGQRAAALAQFESCRQVLADELGVEPDVETMAVLQAIRTGKVDKVTRLRPEAQPEGWQGDTMTVAHPITLSPPHPVMPTLPLPPTPLIGRARELAEVGAMINNPECRLITITGVGGMGKTRLALAVAAAQSSNFQQGALFVPLAGVSSGQFLPQAILSALNIPLQGTLSPQQQVRLTLYTQECLLVLDNYEQLLPDVELLLDILHYAPKITLLVTTRERLALQAEHLCELTGLSYPPQQATHTPIPSAPALLGYGAIELFLQRTRQLQPRFTPNEADLAAIVRICRVSEGMPLALELAAAGVREQAIVTLAAALEAGQARLASRLRDLPERHRTMAGVFDHSWHLLSATEQEGLAALALFRGGFEVEAAQTVANATPAILAGLLDKSWLRRNRHERYEIHELVRQYAHQHLAAAGAFDAVQQRYIAYFLKMAEQASTGTVGQQQSQWMTRIEQEMDNLRAVLTWLSRHAPDDGLAMTLNLYWLWQSTNYLQEGRDWLTVMLAHPASVSPVLRAEAYHIVGFFDIMMNKIAEAEALLNQSLAIYQQLDSTDPQVEMGMADVLCHQGLALLFRGDYAQGLQLCRQSLAVAQRIGDPWSIHSALSFASEALYHQGLLAEAQQAYAQCLALCESMGYRRAVGRAWVRLGNVACAQGDLTQVSTLFTNGLRIAAECHDRVGIGMAFIGLASAAARRGDYHRATVLLAAKEESAITNPVVRFWPLERKENERTLALLHLHLDHDAFHTAWAEGIAMSLEAAVAVALAEPSP